MPKRARTGTDGSTSESRPSKRVRSDTAPSRERAWIQTAIDFIDSDWCILANGNLQPIHNQVFREAGPNWGVVTRDCLNSPESAMFHMLPRKLFDLLARIVNRVRRERIRKRTVSSERAKSFSPVTSDDMSRFYAIVVHLENNLSRQVSSVEDLINQYGLLPQKSLTQVLRELNCCPLLAVAFRYGGAKKIGMGKNRFFFITACLVPSDEEFHQFFNILRDSFRRALDLGDSPTASVDETIFAYQVSKKAKARYERLRDPVPEVTIERKPHKNGLECFMLAINIPTIKLPYVLDFEPHLHSVQSSPRTVLKKILLCWTTFRQSLHIVADSSFGGVDFINELSGLGFRYSMSIPKNDHPFLWPLMERSLDYGQWVACGDSHGFIVSTLCGTLTLTIQVQTRIPTAATTY